MSHVRTAGWTRPAGENVARGFDSSAGGTAWRNSPERRRNIGNCSVRRIGQGHTVPGSYWLQGFGH